VGQGSKQCREKRFTMADLIQMQLASGSDVNCNTVCSEWRLPGPRDLELGQLV